MDPGIYVFQYVYIYVHMEAQNFFSSKCNFEAIHEIPG